MKFCSYINFCLLINEFQISKFFDKITISWDGYNHFAYNLLNVYFGSFDGKS